MTDQSYLEQPDLHAKAPHRAALLSQPSNLKQVLLEARDDPKKTLFGVGQGIPSTFVTKVLASAKPGFIWMDVEHGMFNRLTLHDCIHAVNYHSEGKSMAIVRVPKHDEISLTTALDAGAAGIVIPHCESAAEVQAVIKESFYPPMGGRSFSPWTFTPGISDASLYKGDPYNMETSNRHVAIIAQIESVKGIEMVEEIAALEHVSALMFGPGDFMADAGIPISMGGEPHPVLLAAMGKLAAAGKKYGKPLLGGSQGPEMLPMLIESGYRLICPVMDVWGMANLVKTSMAQGREAIEKVVQGQSASKEGANGAAKEASNEPAVVTTNGRAS